MAKSTKLLWSALLTVAVALSGCADDEGGGSDGGETTSPTTGTTGTGMPTTTGTNGPTPPNGPQPQYINGTVTGVIDCILVSNNAPPTGGDTQTLPAGAANATYELTEVDDPTGNAQLCLYFDDAAMTSGTSGSVPADATSFTVYATGAPEAVSYSVRIDVMA